jgi:ribosomal protein S18 acetylase RimI-like enzyme
MDSAAVVLAAMTEDEFVLFLRWAVPEQAGHHIRTGRCTPAGALSYAKGEYLLALPDGLQTKDAFLYTARDAETGQPVGSLFLMLRRRADALETFVFNVVVHEALRGRGYGRALMLATAHWAREHGTASIGLHVFGHNTAARGLYRSLGFRETNVSMQLDL